MSRKRGFTLVELLIVMAIVAILSMLGGAAYQSSIKKSRNSRRASDIQQIRSALEMYRTDKGYYPLALSGCDTSIGQDSAPSDGDLCGGGGDTGWESLGSMHDTLNPEYLNKEIKDPLNNSSYFYNYQSPSGCDNTTVPCITYTLTYYEEPTTGTSPIEVQELNP